MDRKRVSFMSNEKLLSTVAHKTDTIHNPKEKSPVVLNHVILLAS